jgi:hypothetical protein
MEHLTGGFLHDEPRAPYPARPGPLARQGSTHGGDPPIICGEAAGGGQSLSGAPETVRSGSLAPGTADGAARIEFFEFDPLVIARPLNYALMHGLASCEFRHVLQKPAQASILIPITRRAIRAGSRGRGLIGGIDRPSFPG